MDAAGPGVHGHKVGRQNNGVALQEGMTRPDLVELAAGERLHGLARFEFRMRTKLRNEFFRQQQRLFLTVARKFLHDVALFRMHGDGQIGRQRPGCGCPDGDAGLARQFPAHDRKFHVN